MAFEESDWLLPARAGMILATLTTLFPALAAPRTRGDDPASHAYARKGEGCSPHARG